MSREVLIDQLTSMINRIHNGINQFEISRTDALKNKNIQEKLAKFIEDTDVRTYIMNMQWFTYDIQRIAGEMDQFLKKYVSYNDSMMFLEGKQEFERTQFNNDKDYIQYLEKKLNIYRKVEMDKFHGQTFTVTKTEVIE